jgi:hypothetical protein
VNTSSASLKDDTYKPRVELIALFQFLNNRQCRVRVVKKLKLEERQALSPPSAVSPRVIR